MTALEETALEAQVNASCSCFLKRKYPKPSDEYVTSSEVEDPVFKDPVFKDPVFKDYYDIPMDVDVRHANEGDGDKAEDDRGKAEGEAEGHAGGDPLEANSVGVRTVHTTTQVGLILIMGTVLIKLPFRPLFL